MDNIEIGNMEDCWRWLGWHDRYGYARAWNPDGSGPRLMRAHRAIAEICLESLGHTVHHLCENKWCINPSHLQILDSNAAHAVLHRSCDHEVRDVDSRGKTFCRICYNQKRRDRLRDDPDYRTRQHLYQKKSKERAKRRSNLRDRLQT